MNVDFNSPEWSYASLPDYLSDRCWETARDLFQIQCELAGLVVEMVNPDEFPEIYEQAMNELRLKLDDIDTEKMKVRAAIQKLKQQFKKI